MRPCACQKGAEEAAKELGNVDLIFDGPTENKVDAQIQLIEGYIAQQVNAIVVSPNDPDSISPVLKKARDKGIHVLTFDADASPEKSGREFFINQASEDAVAKALIDEMAAQVGPESKVAIVTASLTAANQNAWIAAMKKYMPTKYPKMTLVCEPKPSEEDQALAFKATQELIKTYPDLQGVFALSSVAFPGAADAVQQAQKAGKVAVLLPDSKSSVRWETQDRKYLGEAFKKAGVDATIVNAEGDKQAQITQAEQAITNGAKVILLVDLDAGSGSAIIKKAQAAGVKVIDYDRLTLGGGADYYVSFDNSKVGKLQGDGLVKCLAAIKATKPVVAELNGSPTDNNATLFAKGYNSVLDPLYADGTYVKGPNQSVPDWDNQKALTIFEQMLQKTNNKIDGVLAANDGLANSVISAVRTVQPLASAMSTATPAPVNSAASAWLKALRYALVAP